MLIWILAIVLFAIAGVCGYKLGAVRFGVSLVGLILAAVLALPLAPYLKPLVPMVGFKNPIWTVVLPPILVFLLIYAIFIGISFFVNRRVELYYKYNAEDGHRLLWERVNKALGLWVGLAVGAVWLVLLGLVIYVAGYFTVQVTTDETESSIVRLTSQARRDLQSTGLDRAVAPFDPMPPRYYEASDILGLIYQNPLLLNRLSRYPTFLLFENRPEFQELAGDAEFNQMLLSKGDIVQIIRNPKLQAVVQNPEIVQELLSQDLGDLRAYLETGVSPRYEEERILGKWKLDPYPTMAQERKRNPEMSSTQMRRLKLVMTEIMSGVSVIATTDNKIAVKAEGVAEKVQQLFQPPTPPPQPVNPDAAPVQGMDPRLLQRYGGRGGAGGRGMAQPTPAPAPAPKPAAQKPVPYVVLSSQGSWERTGDRYELKVQDERGRTQTLQAVADEDRLTITSRDTVLVFAKAE